MKFKRLCLVSAFTTLMAGCAATADNYAADVYGTNSLNQRQEVTAVNIISVMAARVKVDNTKNKRMAQTAAAAIGAIAGSAVGYNTTSSWDRDTGMIVGSVAGGALGAVAGSAVSSEALVDGVTIVYELPNGKTYSSTQVGTACQFSLGYANMVLQNNETRIQPNSICPSS